MAVELNKFYLDTLSRGGISREDIKMGVTSYRQKGLSDDEIFKKLDRKVREIQYQEIRPKNITINASDKTLATSPAARDAGFAYQGMANAMFNPVGYVARAAGVNTRPLKAETAKERIIEASSGALYDTIPFVAGGAAVANSKWASNLANSTRLWPSRIGRGIKALASPAAPGIEIGGAIGGAGLPAAVNLQYPGENASFWDKTKFYGGNIGLGLAGGISGGIIGGAPKMLERSIGRYQVANFPNDRIGSKNILTNDSEISKFKNNGGDNVKQIPTDGVRGEVRLQQEPTDTVAYERRGVATPRGSTASKEEKSAALRELVRQGNINKESSGNGLFISRDSGRRFLVNPKYEDLFDKANISKTSYVQLDKTPESSRRFFDAITQSKKDLGDVGEQVYVYSPDEYSNMKLFLSEDGLSGVAVKPDGDIVSVFNSNSGKGGKGRSHAMIELAKLNGGTKLDAFDTFLPKLYSKHGFKEVGRDVWNEEYRPTKWNKEYFKSWNSGEPDVVYMQFDPNYSDEYISPRNKPISDLFSLSPELKSSRLTTPERLAENPFLSPEAKRKAANLGKYDKISNSELINTAQGNLRTDTDYLKNELLNKKSYEAQDFENARQLVSKLFAEGKEEDALTLIRTVSERGSKAGQSVQSMSLWSKMTPEGAIRNAQKMIADYNKGNPKKPISLTREQMNKIRYFQDQAMRLPEGREKDVFTALSLKAQQEAIPVTAGEKVRSFRNISMLLNPKTLGRNIGGNTGFALVEKGLVDPLAAMLDKGANIFTKKRTRVLPQFSEYGRGMLKGIKEGAEDVKLGINTRNLGGKFDIQPRNAFERGVMGGLEKALNYGLQVPDRAFYEATLRESVTNQMKAQGLKTPTKEILQTAEQEALEAVFQNKSLISDSVQGFRRGTNKLSKEALRKLGFNISDEALGVGDLVIPYTQTPANLAQQSINYSPLGTFKGIGSLSAGNQRAATKDISRSIVGTGGLYGGYELAKNGLMTGDLKPEHLSPKESLERRKNLELLGIRPNQIKIGNKNYSYGQFAPLSTTLSAGAKLAEGGNGLDSILAAGGTIADLPFMDNVNRFYRDTIYQGLGSAIKNQAAGIPSQFVPTASSQIADVVDDTMKETYDPNVLKQGLNTAVNKVPYLRNILPNRLNVLGEPYRKYDSGGAKLVWDAMINPTFVNKSKSQPVIEELDRIYQTTGNAKHYLPLADRKVAVKAPNGENKNVPLPTKAYTDYQRMLGISNYQALANFMESPTYQNMTDEERAEEIRLIQNQINQRTKELLFQSPNKESPKERVTRAFNAQRRRPYNLMRKNKLNQIVNQVFDETH